MERMREERSVVIAGPEVGGVALALDGLYRAGSDAEAGGVLIAPPHPLYGGSMESTVVTELGYAAARADWASLRFDWRGVGASTGAPSGDVSDHNADYAAALHHLSETVSGPLCAAGYSAGAAAAVRAAFRAPRVRRLLLVAPPPAMLDAEAFAGLRGRLLIVVGEEDRLAPAPALRALVDGRDGTQLEILPGVDHFFGTGLLELGRIAAQWLAA